MQPPATAPSAENLAEWRAFARQYLLESLKEVTEVTPASSRLFDRSPLEGEGATLITIFEARRAGAAPSIASAGTARDNRYIVAVGRTDIGVATNNNNNTGLIPPGSSKQVIIGQYNVDEGFFDAMGLTMKAGRWFDPSRPMDEMGTPYPTDEEYEKRLAARGVNVVLNDMR